jgi:hypothetical protein
MLSPSQAGVTGVAAMTDNNDELPEELTQSQIEPAAVEEPATWLHVILAIPFVGDILTALIGFAPMILVFWLVESKFGIDMFSESAESMPTSTFWIILLSIPIWYVWLRYLEKKLNLAICLPLPIVNFRIKWLLIPFGVFWVMLYIGIFK